MLPCYRGCVFLLAYINRIFHLHAETEYWVHVDQVDLELLPVIFFFYCASKSGNSCTTVDCEWLIACSWVYTPICWVIFCGAAGDGLRFLALTPVGNSQSFRCSSFSDYVNCVAGDAVFAQTSILMSQICRSILKGYYCFLQLLLLEREMTCGFVRSQLTASCCF